MKNLFRFLKIYQATSKQQRACTF